MEYIVETEIVSIYKKVVYIDAKNKTEARKKAKNQDWFDAESDEFIDQKFSKVISIKEYK
tara:strand:+ start:235 stop:414 length:180 start_codon:yes stop_codon:yes gene_type:complete